MSKSILNRAIEKFTSKKVVASEYTFDEMEKCRHLAYHSCKHRIKIQQEIYDKCKEQEGDSALSTNMAYKELCVLKNLKEKLAHDIRITKDYLPVTKISN